MAQESEEKEITILGLIRELNKVVDAHGDMPVYIYDEYDKSQGMNTLNGFELFGEEKRFPCRPKRVEFF